MQTLTIPDETYQRLSIRATEMNVSVEDLALPALERVAVTPLTAGRVLTHEEWLAHMDAWMAEVQARAHRYPPGFEVDISREAMYE